MGDRTWVNLKCRKSDLHEVKAIIDGPPPAWLKGGDDGTDPFDEITTEEDGWIDGQIYEGNYGLFTELEKLHEAGIPFAGSSGAGGDYGPATFACDGKTYHHLGASWNGYPYVEISKHGDLMPKGVMQSIREYYLILDRAEQIIEGKKVDDRPELPEEMKNCAGPCKGPIKVTDDDNLCHCCGLYFCDACWDKHDECEPCSDCGQMHITTPCPV